MNKKTRALSKEEYEKIIETIQYGFIYNGIKVQPNPRIATAFVVQANTGLRIGDLLNLRLKDIIKESGRYHFNIKEEKTKKPRTFTISCHYLCPICLFLVKNKKKESKLQKIIHRFSCILLSS